MSQSPPRVSGPHLPLAVVLPSLLGLVILGVLIGRIADARSPSTEPKGEAQAIVAAEPGGSAWPAAVAEEASPTPSAESKPKHGHGDKDGNQSKHDQPPRQSGEAGGFHAEIAACRAIDGNRCIGELDTISRGTHRIWLLVRFENSDRGDLIATALQGPDGAIDTPDFTVRGGDGYTWAQVTGSLTPGDWTAVASRNGEEVASTTFTVD